MLFLILLPVSVFVSILIVVAFSKTYRANKQFFKEMDHVANSCLEAISEKYDDEIYKHYKTNKKILYFEALNEYRKKLINKQ